VCGCAKISANLSKAHEALWESAANLAVITLLVTFWKISGEVAWAADFDT
jgi:hypothetical protein